VVLYYGRYFSTVTWITLLNLSELASTLPCETRLMRSSLGHQKL
jgi:hypothetical protein